MSFSKRTLLMVCAVALISTGVQAKSVKKHSAKPDKIIAAPVNSHITRTDNGKAVAVSALNNAAMTTSLIARLGAGETLKFFDTTIKADAPSAVLLTASSDYLSAAVLKGKVTSDSLTAEAGQLISWPMDVKKPQRFHYDIGRLLASSTPAIDDQLRADMEPALRSQQRAIFWGKLQPAAMNMRAPQSPIVEEIRRGYVQSPAAIEARRATAGDEKLTRKEVANKFVAALVSRDSDTVAELLDPALFKAGNPESWMQSRLSFARKLTASSLPSKLKGYALKESGSAKWSVVADGKTFVMEQQSLNAFPFIRKFEAQ